jgi:hypothetical protein
MTSKRPDVASSAMGRVLALLISFAVSMQAHASSYTLEDAANGLDPSVQSVSLCGEWRHDNESGNFRVIYGWLWGHTEIYVQWLAAPNWFPKEGEAERRTPFVVKTVAFPEYDNYESATDLDNVRCVRINGTWAITANADNANEDEPRRRYDLVIYLYDEPGKFRLVEQRHKKREAP